MVVDVVEEVVLVDVEEVVLVDVVDVVEVVEVVELGGTVLGTGGSLVVVAGRVGLLVAASSRSAPTDRTCGPEDEAEADVEFALPRTVTATTVAMIEIPAAANISRRADDRLAAIVVAPESSVPTTSG